jgi:hypothetical protein
MMPYLFSESAQIAYQEMAHDIARYPSFSGCYSLRGVAQIVGDENAAAVAQELQDKGYMVSIDNGGYRFSPKLFPPIQLDLFASVMQDTRCAA